MIKLQTRWDKGVTLIELMIVLVIAALLVGGIYTLFMTQQRSYSVQDQVVGVQQDARAALNIMARDIRMAGFAIRAGSGTGFTDDGVNTFSINTFNFAVNPTNIISAPDTLTVVLGAEELGTVLDVGGSVVTLDRDVDYYFQPSGSLNTAKCYVAFDLQRGRLYQASSVADEDITLTIASGETAEGGKAYGVQAITYAVVAGILNRDENTGDGTQPLVGDGNTTIVEDLQFAYQVAGDAGWYNDPLTDFPAGMTAANIRMVRINIIMKTAVPDPQETGFFKPACEDHEQDNSDPGNRRRVYTTEVKVRNL